MTTRIPSMEDNPDGLHGRYDIKHADGRPIDPDAVYFVLRLDNGGSDPDHIRACRYAALAYVDAIERGPTPALHLRDMATELRQLVGELCSE